MVRLLVLVLLLFCSQTLLAQKTKLITYDPCNGDNYPTPSGTQKELYDWLENNKKPVDVSKTRRKMVHVAFSIDAEGNIKDAKVFNPLNPAADPESAVQRAPRIRQGSCGDHLFGPDPRPARSDLVQRGKRTALRD